MSSGVQLKKRFLCSTRDWGAFVRQGRCCTRYVCCLRCEWAIDLIMLLQKYQCSFTNCVAAADHSAAALVNILAEDFPCFNDVAPFENRKTVRFLKRAQICVADLW